MIPRKLTRDLTVEKFNQKLQAEHQIAQEESKLATDNLTIETSISAADFRKELKEGLREYNESHNSNERSISEDDIKVAPAPGFTGAEIAIFLGAAIASGITYDVCKYVVVTHVLPRINSRFGADAAKLKEGD